MTESINTICHTDLQATIPKSIYSSHRIKSTAVLVLNLYISVDHYTYLQFNKNENSLIEWVNKTIEPVQEIYLMHDIDIQVSNIDITKQNDGLLSNYSLNDHLINIKNQHQEDISADIFQLITLKNLGGGKAFFEGLCNPLNKPVSVASHLNMNPVQTLEYSWSTYIIAHEIGHMLGSPHTHDCVWGLSQNEAIDNCQANYDNCSVIEDSSTSGSIMSYCYLDDRGINFSNGLGFYPSQLIRYNISQAQCLISERPQCILLQPCDDNNDCTTNDVMDELCRCKGTMLDLNNNEICDYYDECVDAHYVDKAPTSDTSYMSRIMLHSNTQIDKNIDVKFSAGNEIILSENFSISIGSTFEASISECGNDH